MKLKPQFNNLVKFSGKVRLVVLLGLAFGLVILLLVGLFIYSRHSWPMIGEGGPIPPLAPGQVSPAQQ